ncbi:MAG: cyclic nucleotide-binding domain-containing protein [Actinomycetota bacterium]|nr:cyclic nucleotide-binding domain-containing protein [Actinomycetota bacterium]
MSTETTDQVAAHNGQSPNGQQPLSLGTAAARNLATTTKTPPQMQGKSSRWLLKILPWVQVSGGTYRVNRRLSYAVGDGRISFDQTGAEVRVIPAELGELASLRGFEDIDVLTAMAGRFVQQEFDAGDVVVEEGQPANQIVLIAHGKLNKISTGRYDTRTVLGMLGDGDHVSYRALTPAQDTWPFTVTALTKTTVLTLSSEAYEEIIAQSDALRAHIEQYEANRGKPQNRRGEADIALASGHEGEAELPGTFVDYETSPREYQLGVVQTVLRIHTRVADLYNDPMDQTEQQLRLTLEALFERQEHDLMNNRDFGLLHNVDYNQRIHARTGPPTPDDLDELLSMRRNTQYLLAHPRTIAAYGRECNRLGLYPDSVEVGDDRVLAWRGVPFLTCNKIPITDNQTSAILALRVGEDNEGVVGLHQVNIPDEYVPGTSVRFMGINEKAIISYLVSSYHSAAVLVPNALGMLENVEIARSESR